MKSPVFAAISRRLKALPPDSDAEEQGENPAEEAAEEFASRRTSHVLNKKRVTTVPGRVALTQPFNPPTFPGKKSGALKGEY